jgi:5-methylcytosine-specific restriction protein B
LGWLAYFRQDLTRLRFGEALMSESAHKIEQALAAYDKGTAGEQIERAKQQRKEALDRFPLDAWPNMPLERYAVGQEDSTETFCYWMEWGTTDVGSIRGGSSRKLIIYKKKNEPGWYFPVQYTDEKEAWTAVHSGFLEAFSKAQEGDWQGIDAIAALQPGQALLLKTLHLYFPDEVLPISSRDHLRHFLRQVDRPEADDLSLGAVTLNRALLTALREIPELKEWTTKEIERFLYRSLTPAGRENVVKIAPGPDARYWEECRSGSYICVGWDDVGDLRQFESREAFEEAFMDAYSSEYRDHRPTITKKARELWTLRELQSGDRVVANRGTSRVLAVGTVGEPGYRWRPERAEYRHTVDVEWDEGFAKDIPPQGRWGVVTVAPITGQLRDLILERKGPPPSSVDPVFEAIEAGLDWKGQVILYGPPGTGKTYTARRFAVWWLLKGESPELAGSVIEDPVEFDRTERKLSTAQLERRVWWVVANPREWTWDRLFQEGTVRYRYGRLRANYAVAQPGDLVVGYQATPDKRIVALARISKGLERGVDGDPRIELQPVSRVKNGLTFEELSQDPVLVASEPMRFRNHGTLFALTEEEADHVFSLLVEREPDIEPHLDSGESGVGRLTRLTFHPSYSYEDFIEGFRPVPTASGGLSLRMTDGVLKRVCAEAQARPEERFLVLIDEINRANVAKVLGEVITLLEKDKRGLVVMLPQSRDPFMVPRNVFFLATMNTADRSIKLFDVALRRRFAFVELMPDTSNSSPLYGEKVGGRLALDAFLDGLNARVAAREGREKQIGHSYLLNKEGVAVTDPEEFVRIFRQEILPLLQEYCYEDYGTLAEYLGPKLVDSEAKALNEGVLSDADALIDALEEEFGTPGPAGSQA